MSDMGSFRTSVLIENIARRGETRELSAVLVDTGSEYTWAPREVMDSLGIAPERWQGFILADGRAIQRQMGFAVVHAGGSFAPDFVVFAEPGDQTLLGAHSLEGLNLCVDPVRKVLVDAGPVIAAAA